MVLFALCAAALAVDVETATILSSAVAIDTRIQRPDEDALEAYTRLHTRVRGPQGQWFLSLNGTHTVLAGENNEAFWTISPGESGTDKPIGSLQIRTGLLVERWGRLDVLPVLDVLNGRDLRQGPLLPPELMRIPAPMVQLQFKELTPRIEITWLPFSSSNLISYTGTDWSILQQGMLNGLLDDASSWEGDGLTTNAGQQSLSAIHTALGGVLPSQQRSLDRVLSSDTFESNGLNSDIAIRLEASPRRIDVGVVGGWLHSRTTASVIPNSILPYLQAERLPDFDEQEAFFAAAQAPSEPLRPGSAFAGGELNGTVGMVGVRLEGIWEQKVVVSQQWLQASTSPRLQAAAGLDWSQGTHLLVTAEARWSHILEPVPNLWLMKRDHVQLAGTGNLLLFGDRITLQASTIYDASFHEFLIQHAIRWRLNDRYELSAGALWLEGSRDVPTRFHDAMEFSGGPLGYWAFNDNILLAVQRVW